MTYIRSALLINEQDSLNFDEGTIPDAFVFDLSNPTAAPVDSSTIKNKISQLTGGMSLSHHVRFSVSTSSSLRSKLQQVFSADITAVWIAGISDAQQVRDADVEIRRLEMEHGIKPGAISLIPELNTVYPISVLDGILTAVDRIVGVALDLDLICADLVVTNSSSSVDFFVQRHILTDVAMRVTAQNLATIVTNSDIQMSDEKIKMISSTGGSGILTRDADLISSLNHEFMLSRAVSDRAQAISEQWSSNEVATQDEGVTIQSMKRATYLANLANKIDAG
jgi:citrate lyase beta subunit